MGEITNDVKIGEICVIRSEIKLMSSPNFDDKLWRNFKRRARRNGYILPKQALVDLIKHLNKRMGILHKNYVLEVSLEPCGGRAEYKTWDDIPNKSAPCPCGNPTHWLIKYRYSDLRKQNDR